MTDFEDIMGLNMEECNKIEDLLQDYLDGELDRQARAEVEVHLALCSHCRKELAELKVVVAALGSVTLPTIPDESVKLYANRMQRAWSRKRFAIDVDPLWKRVLVYGLPVLAACIIALIALSGATIPERGTALLANLSIPDPMPSLDITGLVDSISAVILRPEVLLFLLLVAVAEVGILIGNQ